ncbi:TetR/AcrR family transcriptional regulator [Paenibacillus nasutitermitis]|uniref:TetR family transcriptional regulator n=1 Tax=Paenibacillus nasutitermitis TaxID=1652958 RepID=A0A916ZE62_9BACL|nr:TetR/AcrR family transcriptional regulator [Paenibacillus nasutitermitis]GGD89206.1 TetR family transcriptional regulator [Paenibacillus nasutitermitis]
MEMPLQLYERDKILEACLAVFARRGYKNTSTGMLGEAAGISKALIFHHFKSKKNLYFSLLEHCYEKGGKVFQTNSVLEYDDFFEAISISMRNKFEYYRKNRDESKLLYEAFYITPEELKTELEEEYADVIQNFERGIKNQVWEQLFEQVDLQSGIDRSEAMEFIMLTLGHFERQFLNELTDQNNMDDEFARRIYDKMDRFCKMIRSGILKTP